MGRQAHRRIHQGAAWQRSLTVRQNCLPTLLQPVHLRTNQLLSGLDTIAGTAEIVGYESEAAFSRAFKKTVGISPSEWRKHRTTAPQLCWLVIVL